MTISEFSDWINDNLSAEQMGAIITYRRYKKNPSGYCDSIDSFFDELSQRNDSRTTLYTPYMSGIAEVDTIREFCLWNGYELSVRGTPSENKLYRLYTTAYNKDTVNMSVSMGPELSLQVVDIVLRYVADVDKYEDPVELLKDVITKIDSE